MIFFNRFFQKKQSSAQGPKKLTLRERLSALRNLPAFFRLVWEASPRMTIINAVLRIARAAMPLAILYTGKLIIDQIVALARGHGSTSHHHLWQLVAIEFGLAILSDSLSRAINLLD